MPSILYIGTYEDIVTNNVTHVCPKDDTLWCPVSVTLHCVTNHSAARGVKCIRTIVRSVLYT